jgi:hypothetical protein
MTPLPINPKVLILIPPIVTGAVLTNPVPINFVANNISPDLSVVITDNPVLFDEWSKGMSFNPFRLNNNNNQ